MLCVKRCFDFLLIPKDDINYDITQINHILIFIHAGLLARVGKLTQGKSQMQINKLFHCVDTYHFPTENVFIWSHEHVLQMLLSAALSCPSYWQHPIWEWQFDSWFLSRFSFLMMWWEWKQKISQMLAPSTHSVELDRIPHSWLCVGSLSEWLYNFSLSLSRGGYVGVIRHCSDFK